MTASTPLQSLNGKVAFVTGAASGIGESIARHLADAGARTVVADIDELAGPKTAAGLVASLGSFCHLDVTSDASVAAAVARAVADAGPIDILVNCAGGSIPKEFVETDPQQWHDLIELNLIGTMRCTHKVLPAMIARRSGRVINIASNAGLSGQAGQAAYSAAKGGIIAFTKTIAREVASAGITVNSVCPGITETPPLRAFRETPEGKAFIDRTAAQVPMGRLGSPADIASTVAFLASDSARFVTGQAWSVSGGSYM
jgi:2-hydroxycyclohexanecarboxyl-CoA dehydrogenase